ncbi:protein phosphatase 2C domain-containing protein [Ditylenchus destructor]|uniref:Protein phosphatase 2C domain-containing protein n=1 Tax=Ditylenchus destructor TaxID=166010 RepID=A0AAD4MMZ9_9BILA|nr:protein phosphatase 2C domain-containing protein [Ditylenchus destructor]
MGATGAPENDSEDGMLAEMRITVARAQGGRAHMEDRHHVEVVRDTNNHLMYVFAAVYDGHGGDEASRYARKHLHINIMKDPLFGSDRDDDVLQAIRNGFIRTHHDMRHYIKDDSTAGTTATCAIFREGKLFFGHVGDSAIIRVSSEGTGKMLTQEHKPDLERDRVEALGGTVMCKGGTWRVARRVSNPSTGEFMADVPKLNMSRALGDFWSKDPTTGEYAVSPEPDVDVVQLYSHDKFIVLVSDGVTAVLEPKGFVELLEMAEGRGVHLKGLYKPSPEYETNYAQFILQIAATIWKKAHTPSDNITVVCIKLAPCSSFRGLEASVAADSPDLQLSKAIASDSSAALRVTYRTNQQLRTNPIRACKMGAIA